MHVVDGASARWASTHTPERDRRECDALGFRLEIGVDEDLDSFRPRSKRERKLVPVEILVSGTGEALNFLNDLDDLTREKRKRTGIKGWQEVELLGKKIRLPIYDFEIIQEATLEGVVFQEQAAFLAQNACAMELMDGLRWKFEDGTVVYIDAKGAKAVL